jgi:hypothetical protein
MRWEVENVHVHAGGDYGTCMLETGHLVTCHTQLHTPLRHQQTHLPAN